MSDKNPEEYITWKIDYWKQLLKELSDVLPLQKGASVLDAGCGPAGVFIALEKCNVKAVDPLLDSYKTLPHFQPEKFPNVHFETNEIESLSNSEQFDTVFCLNAINNVRLATHGDNYDFFGYNQAYQGVTGEELYNKMKIK